MMGNWFAYAMLGLWPIIAIWLYRNKSVTEATLWTVLGGHMFMAVGTQIDLPMIPPLGKTSIPALAAFIGCSFVAQKRVLMFGQSRLTNWLILVFIGSPFVTAELNSYPIFIADRSIPAMTHYDALSAVITQLIGILPFFLGRQLFKTHEDHLLMFRVLIIAGLFYSILILFEIRMSPQLHTWIYGYFPHSFVQQSRGGGFRAVVFMGHGLLVSFFVAITVIAASVFWQLKIKVRQFSPVGVTCYLLFVLLLSKSAGSLMYGVLGFLLIIFASFKMQLRVAKILVLIALLYPTLTITNIIPHQAIINSVTSINPDRAASLETRFSNEMAITNHVRKSMFFGMGSWGRYRVYDEETGRDSSITDGGWVITFGQFGLVGFIAQFGLLVMSVFFAVSIFKRVEIHDEKVLLSAHSLLVAVIMVDQLPNSSLAPWLWLLVGILLGRSEAVLIQTNKKVEYA